MNKRKSKIELKKLIEKTPSEALDYLENIANEDKDNNLLNRIILIKSKLRDVNNKYNSDVIKYDEYSRVISKLHLNILNIIDEIGDNSFEEKTSDEKAQKKFNENETIYLEVNRLIQIFPEIRIQESVYTDNGDMLSSLNTKRHITCNQIITLIEMHNIKLSGVEYRVLAEAFQFVFDNPKAEEYYKKSINNIDEYTDSTNTKVVSIRSYAMFLYKTGRPEMGAKQFDVAILESNNDQNNLFNGYTYQLKFGEEIGIGNYEFGINSYTKAREYFLKISNVSSRDFNLKELERSWEAQKMPLNYIRP